MTNTPPRIAVLVACFNRAAITLPNIAALEAALEAAACTFDIHLLDDASPDRTGERVKAAHPRINVVVSEGEWKRARSSRSPGAAGSGARAASRPHQAGKASDGAAIEASAQSVACGARSAITWSMTACGP